MTGAATCKAVDAWNSLLPGRKSCAQAGRDTVGAAMQHLGERNCRAGGQLAQMLRGWVVERSGGLPGYRTIVTQSDRIGGAFSPAIASYRSARGPLVHQV